MDRRDKRNFATGKMKRAGIYATRGRTPAGVVAIEEARKQDEEERLESAYMKPAAEYFVGLIEKQLLDHIQGQMEILKETYGQA